MTVGGRVSDQEPSLVFRFNEDVGSGAELIRDVLFERGMIEFHPDVHREHEWNLWWKSGRYRVSNYSNLKPWQRLNHHPNSKGSINDITTKDGLLRNMRRMSGVYSGIYTFTPEAFHLPREERLFKDTFRALAEKKDAKRGDNVWIYKPSDLSRGRGIFIIDQLIDLRYGSKSIVQRYLSRPYLISGYKFDLRLYAVVVSYKPLVIYLMRDGIVRFSTEKFDLTSLDNVYSHLTNFSINKHGPSYLTKKVGVGSGCKWTFSQLRYHLYKNNVTDRKLWTDIGNIVILTLLSQASSTPSSPNCFELFGFDIIFDQDLKPWLLEVNFSPAMTHDCSVDAQVKKSLINSICDLLAFTDNDMIGQTSYHVTAELGQSPGSYAWGDISATRRLHRARTRCNFDTYTAPFRRRRPSTRSVDSGISSGSSRSQRSSKVAQLSASSNSKLSSKIQNRKSRYPAESKYLGHISEGGSDSDDTDSYWTTGNHERLPDVYQPPSTAGQYQGGSRRPQTNSRYRYQTQHQSGKLSLHSKSWDEQLKSQMHQTKEATQRYRRRVSGKQSPGSRFSALNDSESGRQYHYQQECFRQGEPESRSENEDDEDEEMLGVSSRFQMPEKKQLVNPLYGVTANRYVSTHYPRLPALIPSFGDLKLLFPFNSTTRQAATQLDEKSIVREVIKLAKFRSKETESSCEDAAIFDIPEVWPPWESLNT